MQIRQGDVFLKKVKKIPKVIDDGGSFKTFPETRKPRIRYGLNLVLAEGEATGHHHMLRTKEFAARQSDVIVKESVTFDPDETMPKVPLIKLVEIDGRTYVEIVDEPASLIHDEHAEIVVDPGIYEVKIQREYTPQAVRRVMD